MGDTHPFNRARTPVVDLALRYALAFASIGAALLLEFLFHSLGVPHPFTSFALSAIALTFWFGGTKPGLIAVFLALLIRGFFFEPQATASSRALYDLVFVLFAALMIWVRRRRSQLEQKVDERTIELTFANAGLSRQREYLDALFELAPDAVILTDENFNVLRVNREFTQMFGYLPDEASGRWLPDLIVPDDLKDAALEKRIGVVSGDRVNIESVRRRKDGSRLETSVVASKISLGSGQVAVYLIYRDVSERKRAEERLHRSEAFLLEAQRLSHTGSWRHDLAADSVTISPEVARIFDVRPDEDAADVNFHFARIHSEDRPTVAEKYQKAAQSKSDFELDYRIVLPDGAVKYVHNTGHPVFGKSGEIVEFVGTVMDVTDQHRARTELENALDQIKRLRDHLHEENLALREQIDQAFMFEEIVGSSPALQDVIARVIKVAPTDSTVLITGETGTGKELIARAIHKRSRRSNGVFMSVNCASIPSSLIASELFGHERGAFTGATDRRQGRFELASLGTIFLDEIGELPPETQIALLRVLQEHEFERVGGNRVLTTDVRVLAATNRDLPAAIASGAFRADLFYRLNVFPIEVPPLRDRKEDIPMLLEYFVKRFAEKGGKQIRKIEKSTLELCEAYPWPGNIRELQNIVERSVILCGGDTFWIDPAWLSKPVQKKQDSSRPLAEALENQEKEIIEAALAESNGKVAGPDGAAARLGIPRSTLGWKIKQLRIKRQKFSPTPD